VFIWNPKVRPVVFGITGLNAYYTFIQYITDNLRSLQIAYLYLRVAELSTANPCHVVTQRLHIASRQHSEQNDRTL